MYQGSYTQINDFKGGYCGNKTPSSLALNEALDLDNIVIDGGGKGWRTRLGNSQINSSAFNSGTLITSLGYFRLSSGTEYLVCVSGTKFGTNTGTSSNQSWSSSFTDSTGSITITTGNRAQVDFVVFDDTLIGFGGLQSAPDAPFKWTGSGNAAVLGGSPPSAYGGFTANNRVFAFATAASPSTIYWSIIGNAEDWSGSGSGSAVVGSLDDNQYITAACILSTNYAIIFKNTSTYQMVLSSSPFPVYTLYEKVGCIGKRAVVNVDGTAYWINQYRRMVSSDGDKFQEYPDNADDIWNSINIGQAQYICGFRQKGVDYDWLVWTYDASGSDTNSKAIIWDLKNQCWLRCTTGYGANAAAVDRFGQVYISGAGKAYKLDQTGVYADASESGAAITGYWRSGWLNSGDIEPIFQPNELGVLYKTKASGTITVNYGFDFIADSSNFTLSQVATSTETRAFKYGKIDGRGNFFNFKVSQSSSTIDSVIDQIYIRGKVYGQKVQTNS